MEPKPKSDNWVEKNDIFFIRISDRLAWGVNGDTHIALIFKDMMKERIWEKYFGPEHITFANGGDQKGKQFVDDKQVQSPWWL